MSLWEWIDFTARALGYLSILGILAGLGIWALYAIEQHANGDAA